MTKKPFGIISFAALGLIVSCGTSISSVSSSLPEETALLSQDVKEKVGLKTVTGLSILSSSPLVATSVAMMDQPWFAEGDSSPVTEEVAVEDFTQYITLMDTLLSEDGAPFSIVERMSDRDAYDYLLDITTRDLAGFQLTYTLYFNYLDETVGEETSSEVTSSETITSEASSEEIMPPSEEPISESSASEVALSEETTPSDVSDSSEASVVSEEGTSQSETSTEQPSETPVNREGDQEDGEGEDDEDDEDEEYEDEEDEEDNRDREDHEGYNDDELRDESDLNEHDRYKDRELGDRDKGEEVFIEGVAIFDGVEYELIGVQEIEIDEDETETETKFFITLDDQNWIRIKSELETDLIDGEVEEKYSVAMKKDGEFSKMSFKMETEADGEMKIALKTLINGELISYTFRRKVNEETGETFILIRVIENQQVLHILAIPSVDEVTGEIVYTFTVRETGRGYEGRPGHGDDHRDGDRR